MTKIIYLHDIVNNKNINPYLIENLYTSYSNFQNFIMQNINGNFINPKKKLNLQKNSILLNFDDGYKSFLDLALPLLEKHKIPAMIFITTGFVNDKRWPYEIILDHIINSLNKLNIGKKTYLINTREEKENIYQKLRLLLRNKSTKHRDVFINKVMKQNKFNPKTNLFLNWEEIMKLDKNPLITIGAHTKTHPVLTKINPIKAYKEIKDSKKILSKKLGHEINYFTYPYGANSFLIRKLVYFCGFNTRFNIPRIYLNSLK